MEIHKNEEKAYSHDVNPRIIHNSRKLEFSNYYIRNRLRKVWLDVKQNVCSYEEYIYKDLFIARGNIYNTKWEK